MSGTSDGVAYVTKHLHVLGPLLSGLDAAADVESTSEKMAQMMVQTGLDGLISLGLDRKNQGALATADGSALEGYYTRIIRDEVTARAHVGLEPPPLPKAQMERMADNVDEIKSELNALRLRLQPRIGPLFSEAADSLYNKLSKARGADHPATKDVKRRSIAFLQLVPDKPVEQYDEEDVQSFVNEIQHLHPDYSTQKDYDVHKLKQYIDENKKNGGQRLAQNTIENNVLPPIFGIIRHGCKIAKVEYPLSKCKIVFAPEVPKPRNQVPPDYETLNGIFRKGIATEVLVDALLPPLAYVVGRRLGILAFLRAEDIRHYHGCYIVAPKDIVVDHKERFIVPLKTITSMNFYVLNNFFVDSGIVAWMLRQKGFVFKHLHENTKSPANAAQKRMARLLDGEADAELFQTFHGLRHGRKAEDIDNNLSPAASAKQAGRAPSSVDDLYGQGILTAAQVRLIATAPLSKEIDWQIFNGLNWDKFAQNARWPRGFAEAWPKARV